MSDSKPKRATLHDVARAANVSYQTVSRVINNNPNVASDTRSRVTRVMRELDYRPNRAAQMLSGNRSHMLELVTLDVWGLHTDLLAQMAHRAKMLGYQFTITTLTLDNFTAHVTTAAARLVDGIIIAAQRVPYSDDELSEMLQETPFVKIKGDVGTHIATVTYDQQHGARLATQHLIDLGHCHIAHITGAMELYDGRARYESWLATLHDAGLEPGAFAEGSFSVMSGHQAMVELLEGGKPFTAVFAANDDMTVGAYSALWERGLRVPDDISIIGFDDMSYTGFMTPPLTTIRQDSGLIGRLAVEHLVSFIEQPDAPIYQRVVKPELILRSSTKARESSGS